MSVCVVNCVFNWTLSLDGLKIFNGLILEYMEIIFTVDISFKLYGYFIEIV